MQDVYFLKLLDRFFKDKLSLENYVLKLNFLGCSEDRKKNKQALHDYLEVEKSNLCKTCLVRKEKNIIRVFDCKEETCQAIYRDAPKLANCLCDGCKIEWDQLKKQLELLAVNFVHDPLLVRGLDYYNKTVFEFVCDDLGAQNAFCGGGRYELGRLLGAKKEVPSIGAAIGIGRLLMLVEGVKDRLAIPFERALNLVIPMSEAQQSLALLLADTMHVDGICTDILLDGGSMKSMMRRANKMGASYVLILGEDEQENGTVTVKNMTTGDSQTIKQIDVVSFMGGCASTGGCVSTGGCASLKKGL
jgi:histidyl-tRNA synthetase